MIIYDVCNDNNIGDSGGSVIGEGLKFNSSLTELWLWGEESIMYDWEFHDDMIDLWLFMMCIMIIILEFQEEVWLGKDWSSIQHSQNCICIWGVNNVWLRIWWWYD